MLAASGPTEPASCCRMRLWASMRSVTSSIVTILRGAAALERGRRDAQDRLVTGAR